MAGAGLRAEEAGVDAGKLSREGGGGGEANLRAACVAEGDGVCWGGERVRGGGGGMVLWDLVLTPVSSSGEDIVGVGG